MLLKTVLQELAGLEWNKMTSVTTDGARALTAKKVLLKLMNDKIKAEHPGHALTPLHCVIHQGSLRKGALNIKHVTDSIVDVVNLIRAKGLNHKQFKAFLEDLESEHWDVLYHSWPLAEPGQGIEESMGAKRRNRDVLGNEKHSVRFLYQHS